MGGGVLGVLGALAQELVELVEGPNQGFAITQLLPMEVTVAEGALLGTIRAKLVFLALAQ